MLKSFIKMTVVFSIFILLSGIDLKTASREKCHTSPIHDALYSLQRFLEVTEVRDIGDGEERDFESRIQSCAETVQKLIDDGVDPSGDLGSGMTPLAIAQSLCADSVVEVLLSDRRVRAQVDDKAADGKTLLDWAKEDEEEEDEEALLRGSGRDRRDYFGTRRGGMSPASRCVAVLSRFGAHTSPELAIRRLK